MAQDSVPPTAELLAELDHVGHDFTLPSGRTLAVLRDVSFGIHANEIVALLGPSGCGKSTILRILAGLIRPTSGAVRSRGRPLAGLRPDVAIVFQSFALYPWLSVEENIAVVLEAAGLPKTERKQRTEHVIKLVGLAGLKAVLDADLVADSDLEANGGFVKDWSESSRYARQTKVKAQQLYHAITDKKHGVLPWIKRYW